MIHPLIQQFQAQAEFLDLQQSQDSLDDAVVQLATWIGLAEDRLTADDVAVLVTLGGVLYREGLRKRQP